MTIASLQIDLVHGGFVLKTFGDDSRTEVFTSQGKLMKALRTFIDDNTLIVRAKADADDSKES